jgi:hypothetical protein
MESTSPSSFFNLAIILLLSSSARWSRSLFMILASFESPPRSSTSFDYSSSELLPLPST